MPLRPPAGFISAFFDPLNNPNAPTIGTATAGDATASVTFTPPTNVGGSAISSYSALSTPGGVVASATSSPISVTGLSNGTAYTFAVWATNTYGPSAYSAASGSVTPAAILGLFAGGQASGSVSVNTIDRISFSSTGNATDFGDLLAVVYSMASCASSTRGLFAGGNGNSNVIQYVTIATTGNSTDFGDLTVGRPDFAGCNSSTRGVFGGGATGVARNVIDYVTIASVGNATDFGDLTIARGNLAGASSPTRGVFAGGATDDPTDSYTTPRIDYITIASTGNATNFGDLTLTRFGLAGCSSSTRAIFAGGNQNPGARNVIDYITIASTGAATDFGDLISAIYNLGGCSSTTRGVFGGGATGVTNVIQYVTIATTGNAIDFGDLTQARENLTACSSANGGL